MRRLMMLVFIVGSTSVLCNPWLATFPIGHFSGSGTWTDTLSQNGDYVANAEIQVVDDEVIYSFNDIGITASLTIVFYSLNEFFVLNGSDTVGEGYCDSDACNYHALLGTTEIWESLAFRYNDNVPYLVRFGQTVDMTTHGTITWQDVLLSIARITSRKLE